MHFIEVTAPTDPLAEQIEKLYLEAFPAEERKPVYQLYQHQEKGYSKVFAIVDDLYQFIGLCIVIYDNQVMVMEYLATASDRRGNRFGSRILSELMLKYPDHHIVLEIEETKIASKDINMRLRRRNFYERNQFNFYNQTVSYFGVPLELMGTRNSIDYQSYIQPYILTYGPGVVKDIFVLD